MKKFKRLYSCIDLGCMDRISQSIQQRIIKLFAKESNAKIVFVTNEDIDSIGSQFFFKSKLAEKPKVDGFIFFTLDQFCYDGINFNLIKKIFKKKYDLYFAKEELIFKHDEKIIFKVLENYYKIFKSNKKN